MKIYSLPQARDQGGEDWAEALAMNVLQSRGDLMHVGTEKKNWSSKNLVHSPRSISYHVLLAPNRSPCCLPLPLQLTGCRVPPVFIQWNPNPQCDSTWRRGLWEVGPFGMSPHQCDTSLIRETPENSLAPSMRTQWEDSCLRARKQTLTWHWICQRLDLGLPVSWNVRNKFPHYGILL